MHIHEYFESENDWFMATNQYLTFLYFINQINFWYKRFKLNLMNA